ncbi:hypothetical protein [Ancylobacter sp. SL191]|uniref:hypothetical protein n=1 Tax=Ancylobacter sp. SL191 TaxID=2995166 RepID=UPI00226D4C8E|nr:hypothetical protein [Ancylobacter sp. SL191]WAC28781.1 hypothetical protein OU996_06990 [Ancylobacter sp. SL191]
MAAKSGGNARCVAGWNSNGRRPFTPRAPIVEGRNTYVNERGPVQIERDERSN